MMNFNKLFRLSALLCLFGFINHVFAYPVSYCRLVRPQDGKCVDLIGDAHIPQRRSESENTLIKTIAHMEAQSEKLTVLWERPRFLDKERDKEVFAEHFNKFSKLFLINAWLELQRKNLKKVNLIAADNRPLEFYISAMVFYGMNAQEQILKKYNPQMENLINSLDSVQPSAYLKLHSNFSRDKRLKKSLAALKEISFDDLLKNHLKEFEGAAFMTVMDKEILDLIASTNERVLVCAGYNHIFNIRALLEKAGFKVIFAEGINLNAESNFYQTKVSTKLAAKILTYKNKNKLASNNDVLSPKEVWKLLYEVMASMLPEVKAKTWQKLLTV